MNGRIINGVLFEVEPIQPHQWKPYRTHSAPSVEAVPHPHGQPESCPWDRMQHRTVWPEHRQTSPGAALAECGLPAVSSQPQVINNRIVLSTDPTETRGVDGADDRTEPVTSIWRIIMSHQVESMFYRGENGPPWHGLGTEVYGNPTAAEAIQHAGLDWEVVPEPVYVERSGGRYRQVSEGESQNYRAMVRDRDGAVLAIVGKQYSPLQNQDAFRFFDPFIESGYFEYEAAGSLAGGKRVWVLASLKDGEAEVVKGDPIRRYILLSNSHDGSSPVIGMATNIRVVCANTEAAAMSEGMKAGTIRHTRNVNRRLPSLQERFAALNRVYKESLEVYRHLAKVQIDQEAMKLYTKALFGKQPDDDLPKGGSKIVELFESGQGNNLPGARGTMWAAYNAVTEYIDHHRGEGSKKLDADARRLESAWFGQGMDLKVKALELARKGAIALAA